MSPSGVTFPYDPYDPHPALVTRGPSLLLRLRVRWRTPELDAALAAGVDPEGTRLLSLRAEKLATTRQRARLARALERVVDIGDADRVMAAPAFRRMLPSLPVRRHQVRSNRVLLLQLAQRLREDRPLRAQGLALAERLITDDNSPLYTDQATLSLQDAVRVALGKLDRSSRSAPPVAEAAAAA
jgi:hypothetical protein